ncbi:MAG: AAA family ATPase [Pseudobutyrivibrio sp.]|nr:AAA family ATPase [Pseudobutyrivibrio sp.]
MIINGARQVGKTESIMRFAKGSYDNIIYINFALEKKYCVKRRLRSLWLLICWN